MEFEASLILNFFFFNFDLSWIFAILRYCDIWDVAVNGDNDALKRYLIYTEVGLARTSTEYKRYLWIDLQK